AKATKLVPKSYAKATLGIPQHCHVIGFIARLVPQKAPHIFLEAAAKVLLREPDTFFLVVGDGPLRRQSELLAAQMHITSRVRFCGFVDDLSHIYSAMDVAVLTSRYEGLPMVVL